MQLIGPFTQILPLSGLPMKGAINDEQLTIIQNGGVIVADGLIVAVGDYHQLLHQYPQSEQERIEKQAVLLPGFIDCHTHICYGGNRAKDYALRIAGKSYLEIAKAGGGIWDSVTQTRLAETETLVNAIQERANRHLSEGVTTIEVKSGYGLSVEQELKQLTAIQIANQTVAADLIPTCLATHILPKDFLGDAKSYLEMIVKELLPQLQQQKLANRIDIFIEESAYSAADAIPYLHAAKAMGFDITVHADQFTTSGSAVAVELGAVSADHLEASTSKEIQLLANSDTVAVVLPGASLGLGMQYAPARKLLDAGACVAIASDWNPGSAPMGDLLGQAAIIGASEKLSTSETFAALTFRAAKALNLSDRGIITSQQLADLQAFPCADYREILYYQGKLNAFGVWKKGMRV